MNTANLTVNADMFIIPNSMCRVKSFICESVREEKISMMNKLIINDYQYNENDYLFQIWITADNETFKSENAQCHMSKAFTESGEEIKLYPNEFPDVLPIKPFLNMKEGDVVPVTFPIEMEDKTINLTMNLRLAQTEYRYSFGRFEEVLRKI